MKVFVTGATGFIGSAVVEELIRDGHQVIGLARSESSASSLLKTGASVLRGSLEDLEILKNGAASADGVIHTGFIHDFTKFKESCEIDRKAIAALGEGLQGTKKPLIVTSGTGLLPQGRLSTEEGDPPSDSANPRVATEEAVRALVGRGQNVSLLRLPPSVHAEGDHGFIPILINMAKEKRVSAYIGEGKNKWSAVHRLDAARLFKLALEKGYPGAKFHGVAEEGIAFRQIAEVIGKNLKLPVISIKPEAAASHFTWFAHFAAVDAPTSSERTQKELGWNSNQVGLIEDINGAYYYK